MKKLLLVLVTLALTMMACQATSSIQPTATLDASTLFPETETPAPAPTATLPEAVALSGMVRVDNPQIRLFDMLDEQNGWASAASGILKTLDGGATWLNVPLPGNPEVTMLGNPFAHDADHVWVVAPDYRTFDSGTMYRTSDGGVTWQSNPVPFGGAILDFPIDGDHNQGWAMAGLGVAAGSMGVSVFQTRDGGLTWTRTYTNDPNLPNPASSLPLGGMKATFTAYDMQTAFIGGSIPMSGTIYFYVTRDGGVTWSPVDLPLTDELAASDMVVESGVFFTGNTGYLPVRVLGPTPELVFYFSNDDAQTWSLLPGVVANGIKAHFFTAADGFAFDGARFYSSNNSAMDWTTITPNVDFSQSFSMMDFVWTDTGWVLAWNPDGTTALYKTADGGTTWQVLK